MNAIRKIIKPRGRSISFDLPADFLPEKEVEIIVLPAQDDTAGNSRKKLLGKYKGQMTVPDSFNEPLEEFQEY